MKHKIEAVKILCKEKIGNATVILAYIRVLTLAQIGTKLNVRNAGDMLLPKKKHLDIMHNAVMNSEYFKLVTSPIEITVSDVNIHGNTISMYDPSVSDGGSRTSALSYLHNDTESGNQYRKAAEGVQSLVRITSNKSEKIRKDVSYIHADQVNQTPMSKNTHRGLYNDVLKQFANQNRFHIRKCQTDNLPSGDFTLDVDDVIKLALMSAPPDVIGSKKGIFKSGTATWSNILTATKSATKSTTEGAKKKEKFVLANVLQVLDIYGDLISHPKLREFINRQFSQRGKKSGQSKALKNIGACLITLLGRYWEKKNNHWELQYTPSWEHVVPCLKKVTNKFNCIYSNMSRGEPGGREGKTAFDHIADEYANIEE